MDSPSGTDEENLFKKIAEEIYKNRAVHEKIIKNLVVKTELCSIEEYNKNYQQEVCNINTEIQPSNDSVTISDFKNLFETFETYPHNLHKAKKSIPKEANRTIANIKSLSIIEPCYTSSPRVSTSEQSLPAAEVYNGLVKFKKTLGKLLEELKQEELEMTYLCQLQKLNAFAKSVKKLCGSEGRHLEEAFSKKEETIMHQFVENLEKALFIDSNRNLFQDQDLSSQPQNNPNLENVMELLTYWFDLMGDQELKNI